MATKKALQDFRLQFTGKITVETGIKAETIEEAVEAARAMLPNLDVIGSKWELVEGQFKFTGVFGAWEYE